jgi:hypothetical protein
VLFDGVRLLQALFVVKNGSWGGCHQTSFVPFADLRLRWFGSNRPSVFAHLGDSNVKGITFGVTRH